MDMRIAMTGVVLIAFLGACSSAPPPRAGAVRATVQRVAPSAESVMYVTATLAFVNTSGDDVEVTRYRITWPGGNVVVDADGLLVRAGGAIERTARIDPNAGDLAALLGDPARPRVEVLTQRAGQVSLGSA